MRSPWSGSISTLDKAIRINLLIAILLTTSHPTTALAFVDEINQGSYPMIFGRDPNLPDTAIVGIEMWPKNASVDPQHQFIWHNDGDWHNGRKVAVIATAYSSTPEETDSDPFTTASGTHVHPGTLAANFLPFGTQVRINDVIYTVEDRLHPRYNNRLIVDIWHTNKTSALQFGVRIVTLEIVSLP